MTGPHDEPDDRTMADALARLRDAGRALPLPPVPAAVTQRLRQLFRNQDGPRQYEATLVDDSRAHRELAGVRSGPVEPIEGWSLTYASALGDVIVDVWPEDGPQADIDIHALGDEASHGYRVVLTGAAPRAATTDARGQVSFRSVSFGRYELVLDGGDHEIVADVLLGPASE
jgi:hypothetical protein